MRFRRMARPRPLTRAAVELLNAANGLRPLSGSGYSTVLAFWLGWPTSEVPGVYLGASVLDALRRGRRGDFGGLKGKAALALTAAAWVILAVIRYRGATTPGPVLEAGLTEQLGPDYAKELATLPTEPMRSRGRNLPLRTAMARRRYVETTNVVCYGPYGRANLADIWRRRDLPRDAKAPVLVQVPGGAWVLGWRRPQAYPLMSHLAARGWVCVSLNYRVSPRHTWPDHIVDVKRALAWVKENIAAYGGDPNFVAISGGSAGGHLCALAALTPNDPRFQPGFEQVDTSVAAAVPVYGRYDWFTTDAPGRREFVGLLETFVVPRPTRLRRLRLPAGASHRRGRGPLPVLGVRDQPAGHVVSYRPAIAIPRHAPARPVPVRWHRPSRRCRWPPRVWSPGRNPDNPGRRSR